MKPKHIMSLRWQISLLIAGIFLLFARVWVPLVYIVWNHGIFITIDSMEWLGVSSLVALIGCYLVPDFLIFQTAQLKKEVERSFLRTSLLYLFGLFFGLYVINQYVLHAFMSSADEHSCYFLAECLRRGKLFVSPHPLSEFFNVVHVGNRDGKWFSVYPIGWPLIWSVGLRLNIVDWLNPALTTLSLVFFYKAGKRVFGRTVSWLSLVLISFSPFFLFTSASYFSHGTCLFMISVFLWSYFKWQDSTNVRMRTFWAVVVAFAVGYGLMTRYLTMAAVAAPFLIYHFYPKVLRKKPWEKSDFVLLAVIAVFMLSILYQNYLITGKPFRAPNKHDKSWEKLGFRSNYTVFDGLFFIISRFFYLADWFPPALIVVFLVSFFQKRFFNAYQQLMRYGFFYVVFAYFFYFSWGGNQFGPRYYYEAIPFLTLMAAESLMRAWQSGDIKMKKFVLSLTIMSIASSFGVLIKQAQYVGLASSERKIVYEMAERTTDKPAIVFLKGFLGRTLIMSEDDAVRNSPYLDGEILYAHDLGEKNEKLKAYYPDRAYYRGSYDQEKNQPKLEKI